MFYLSLRVFSLDFSLFLSFSKTRRYPQGSESPRAQGTETCDGDGDGDWGQNSKRGWVTEDMSPPRGDLLSSLVKISHA